VAARRVTALSPTSTMRGRSPSSDTCVRIVKIAALLEKGGEGGALVGPPGTLDDDDCAREAKALKAGYFQYTPLSGAWCSEAKDCILGWQERTQQSQQARLSIYKSRLVIRP
jgi:hypothetical protein